jgi:hypothetical protein
VPTVNTPPPDKPAPLSRDERIREARAAIKAEQARVEAEANARPGDWSEEDSERFEYLRYLLIYIEDIIDGKPVPPFSEWSSTDDNERSASGGTDDGAASSGSTGGGSDTGGGEAPAGGDEPGGGVEAMPGSDIVTGRPRGALPGKAARISLQQAVGQRLGGVIDPGDFVRLLVADPAVRAHLMQGSDVVRPGDVHPPHSPEQVRPDTPGDPRTGGAVDPAEDDPRHRRQ